MGARRAGRKHGRVQSILPASSKRVKPQSGGVSKAARRAQSRGQKKAAILAAARKSRASSQGNAPLCIALIAAAQANDADLARLSSMLMSVSTGNGARALDIVIVKREGADDRTVLLSALDIAKVADMVLLVFKGREDSLDALSLNIVAALREQGMPSLFAVAMGEGADDGDLKKLRGRQLAAESLGVDHTLRPVQVDCEGGETSESVNKLAARKIFAKRPRTVSWRSRYGYMRVESAASERANDGTENLTLCGWIKGRGFSSNELVHVTGFGSYAARCIIDVTSGKVLSRRSDTDGEPVESEAEVDGMMGEQTWPPEVDDVEEEDEGEKLAKTFDESVDEDDGQMGEDDRGEAMMSDDGEELELGDDDEMSVDEAEVNKVREAARTDALFPDEIDTPINQPARQRFARYRGLKSLRTGEWDPKEQLPREYATLFQFRNLAATRKRVLDKAKKDAEEAADNADANFACAGQKVYLQLLDVPTTVQQEIIAVLNSGRRPVVASGMLRHENRRSVVHFGLQRVDDDETEVDIKAKTRLEMHCGFVRFEGKPMFSEHNANSDKHKMERFLRHGRYTVASFYGPAVYAPAPALLFHPGGSLIATGTALGADPDRIILKRIILTGYPFKTQKRRSVVKFMFFNPDDVRWFKPVELWSKMGRSGHILEPVGTHGHMKCIFDNVILHHDTVCMTLYKRVYPKLIEQKD